MKKGFFREGWYRIILLTIGLGSALFIGEVGARLYFFGMDAFSYEKLNSFDNLFKAGVVQPSSIDGLNYELKPNLNTYYKLFPFKTNASGMREVDQEYVGHKKVRKIAMIGDSFTMGTGVPFEGIYHSVAERNLNEQSDSIEFRLLNFGVSGYNLNEYVVYLKNAVIAQHPDEVVIGFCSYNDHYRPEEYWEEAQLESGLERSGFWKSYLRRLISIRLNPPKDISADPFSSVDLNYMENKLWEIKSFCESRSMDVSLIFLAINHKPKEAKQIQTISDNLGIKFIDSSHLFEGQQADQFIFNELDGHPNDKAHELFAQALVEMLTRE